MGTKLDAATQKITLIELDLAKGQTFWLNWSAYTWYVDFDMVYDLVDPSLLIGAPGSSPIVLVGSALSDYVTINNVASVAACVSTANSFYFDPSARRLYVHLTGGADPALHAVQIGITQGVSNVAGTYNGVYYEPRVINLPTISKHKDPLFFGRIALGSNTISLDNHDGAYDLIGENQGALYGAEVRILQGFDSDPYASFVKLATRMVENVRVSQESVEFDCVDKRKGLVMSVPDNCFYLSNYPYLDPSDEGKTIPLLYGTCYKIPVICTNRAESGPPANYHFKLADTVGAGHPIRSIDAVYVKGVAKTILNVSLANATFDIAAANYTAGDEVTVDCHGFTGTPSQNMDNLIDRGDCESVTGPAIFNETVNSLVNSTFARSAAQKRNGSYSYLYTKTIAAGTTSTARFVSSLDTANMHGMIANHTYTISVWVYIPSVSGATDLILKIMDYSGGSWNTSQAAAAALLDQWQLITITRTLSAGATGALMSMEALGTNAINTIFYIDDIIAIDITAWMIQNPADVMIDILGTWLGIPFTAPYFNLTEWNAATALLTATFLSGIGIFINAATEVYSILQDICASCALNLIPQDDGKLTLRMYDAARAVSQDFSVSDLLDVPSYEYDVSQLISYTSIEYARTWYNNNHRRLMDTSQDAAIFAVYGKHVLGTFSTLLVSAADAQALSTILLLIQGAALRKFSVRFKMQPFDREIMDFITLYIARPSKNMIGRVKAEIIGKSVTASKEVVLDCRIVANI